MLGTSKTGIPRLMAAGLVAALTALPVWGSASAAPSLAPSLEKARAYQLYLQANEQLSLGRVEAARKTLESVLEVEPNAGFVRASLARLCLRQGDVACAREQAGLAVEADPQEAEGHKVLAEIDRIAYQKTGDLRARDSLLAHLEAAVEAEPMDLGVWVAWIRHLGRDGRIDDAAEIARRAASVQGINGAVPWIALARILMSQNRAGEAIRVLERAETTGRGAGQILGMLAELKGRAGDLDGQAEALEQLRKLRPGDPDVAQQLGRVRLEMLDPYGALAPLQAALEAGPQDALVRRDVARTLVRLGRGRDALPLFDALPQVYLSQATLFLWSRAAVQADEWALAANLLERLIGTFERGDRATESNLFGLRFKMAEYLLKAGDAEGALGILKTLGEHPRVLRLQCTALRSEGKDAEAAKLIARARKAHAGSPALAALEVDLLLEEGERSAALEVAAARIAANRKEALYVESLASGLLTWGRADVAGQILDAHPIKEADDAQALRIRASVMHEAGRSQDAEAYYRKLLAMRPDDHGVQNDLGYLLANEGRSLEEATEMLRAALAAEPGNPSYMDSLGWALHRSGRSEEALPLLQRAVVEFERIQSQQSAEILEHLGDVYDALGDDERALAEWRAALPRAEEAARIERLQKKIDSGLALEAAKRRLEELDRTLLEDDDAGEETPERH